MNSLIIPLENLHNNEIIINDLFILNHLHTVLKTQVNKTLRVTVLSYGIFKTKILELTPELCRLEIIKVLPSLSPWIHLIVGISRPQTVKKILEHGPTFGVGHIHFYKAELSEKSYLDTKILQNNAFKELTHLGLSQSAIYFHSPQVTSSLRPEINENIQQRFVLDLTESRYFAECDIDFSRPLTLAIGPERGFTPEDLNFYRNHGFQSIKVSSSILRVEHAIYAAISQLELLKNKK